MRTLERNKIKLWCISPSGTEEVKDADGFFTGEVIKIYGSPQVIYLNIAPSIGAIVEDIFGKDASFDMIAITNEVVLSKDSLLFLNEPTSNYDTTYDYSVQQIKKSLNTYQYGLKGRV